METHPIACTGHFWVEVLSSFHPIISTTWRVDILVWRSVCGHPIEHLFAESPYWEPTRGSEGVSGGVGVGFDWLVGYRRMFYSIPLWLDSGPWDYAINASFYCAICRMVGPQGNTKPGVSFPLGADEVCEFPLSHVIHSSIRVLYGTRPFY